jgi:hypothetical protein
MFLDPLLSTPHILLRLSSTLELLMLSSTASRSLTHLSRRPLPLPYHASPSTTTSLLKPSLMLELLDSWSFAFKNQSLLSRESQPLPLERLPSTLRSSPKPLSIKEPSHILLPSFLTQMPNSKDMSVNALPKSPNIPSISLRSLLRLKSSQEFLTASRIWMSK